MMATRNDSNKHLWRNVPNENGDRLFFKVREFSDWKRTFSSSLEVKLLYGKVAIVCKQLMTTNKKRKNVHEIEWEPECDLVNKSRWLYQANWSERILNVYDFEKLCLQFKCVIGVSSRKTMQPAYQQSCSQDWMMKMIFSKKSFL